jgi:putative flippase GtrA
VISVVIAFILHRRLVFRVRGHVWLDFIRFQSVYVVTFTVNLVLLPILVAVGVPRIAAQAAIVAVMTVVSYFAHRHFSFRRKPEPFGDSSESDLRE